MKLAVSATTKALMGFVLIGAMLFWPAGTFDYPGAWIFIGALFIPMVVMGAVMLAKSPDMLEQRLKHKEKEVTQKGIIALSGLMFPAGFILSAVDFRFGWSRVPMWVAWVATGLFLAGYAMYAEIMRENAYLSRIIEVQEGQKVVSTGLYGIVRHPMYLATFFMFLPMPLMLQSYWGLVPLAIYPILIVFRIFNEEKVLEEGLEGYKEYKEKVKYRLIPFVW